jgi:hypothetical protein
LQNRLIKISQTGGQWYSDTSPFSIPWLERVEVRLSAVNLCVVSLVTSDPKCTIENCQ